MRHLLGRMKSMIKTVLIAAAPKQTLKSENTVFINSRSWKLFREETYAELLKNTDLHIAAGDIKLVRKQDLGRIAAYIGVIDPSLLKHMRSLQWLQIASHGYNGFDNGALYANRDVTVTNLTDVFSKPMAEYCVAAYHYFNCYALRNMSSGSVPLQSTAHPDCPNVLILGAGNIGSKIAELCKKQGWQVCGVKRTVPAELPDCFDRLVRTEQLFDVLPQADYVINILPETAQTVGICNKTFFDAMKQTAVFCNVGRGSAVVDKDLQSAVQSGSIRGAILDAGSGKTYRSANIVSTHHMSSVSAENDAALDRFYSAQLTAFLQREPLKNRMTLT